MGDLAAACRRCLGLGILAGASASGPAGLLKIACEAGIRGQAVVHEQPNPTRVETDYLRRIGWQVNFETLL